MSNWSSTKGRKRGKNEPTEERSSNATPTTMKKFYNPLKKHKALEAMYVTPNCYSTAMCGVDVKLPIGLVPYRTQRLMMVRILTAIQKKQHVLAESPTGSGKTMALLASTCAYLVNYKKEREESFKKCSFHNKFLESRKSDSPPFPDIVKEEEDDVSIVFESINEHSLLEDSENEFVKTRKRSESSFAADVKWEEHFPAESGDVQPENEEEPCTCLPALRIYYGTRTHKQIGQVVKEYGRLPYADQINHTILGSREQLCINEEVRKRADMTAACKESIRANGIGCRFKTNMRDYERPLGKMRDFIRTNGASVWDIEDLLSTLAESRPPMCPYFAATRTLAQDAELIFCPFSYLIDPIIRSMSEVRLTNAIVVLDEAHNVEDNCREAASFTFTEQEVNDAISSLREKSINLRKFLCDFNKYSSTGDGEVGGVDQVQQNPEPTHEKLLEMEKHLDLKAMAFLATPEQGETRIDIVEQLRPSSTAIVCVEKFLFFLKYFSKNGARSKYRLNISIGPADFFNQTVINFDSSAAGPRNKHYTERSASKKDSWLDSKETPENRAAFVNLPIRNGSQISVSLWCMSPELAFLDAFSECCTLVLASGTLCPMETLKTELGLRFSVELEGDQVIPKEQIFASVLRVGPGGNRLLATYKTINDNDIFMDELARIVRSICYSVPAGVLCFLSSYKLLERLHDYLRRSTILRQIEARKVVVREPRRSSEMTDVMSRYESAICDPSQFGIEVDGGLMLAVFRGKVSEGIDFTDDRARCVITVGIPFPNFVDEMVKEKRKYNDVNSREHKILTGEQWYNSQAYRALNQALGRCLRHRNDWGAIVMVDERLANVSTVTTASARVSKWIREQSVAYSDYGVFESRLKQFIFDMMTKDFQK